MYGVCIEVRVSDEVLSRGFVEGRCRAAGGDTIKVHGTRQERCEELHSCLCDSLCVVWRVVGGVVVGW